MIYGEASTTVTASPAEVLDFVCDPYRYRLADHKIGRVLGVEADGQDRLVRFRPRLRGLPGPSVRQRVHRSGDDFVDITDMPSWRNRLLTFDGHVTCRPTPAGTLITHRERFDFHGPLRPLAERLLASWLAADVWAEVDRIQELLGAAAAEISAVQRPEPA
jgi:hypothetical protein